MDHCLKKNKLACASKVTSDGEWRVESGGRRGGERRGGLRSYPMRSLATEQRPLTIVANKGMGQHHAFQRRQS